MYDKPVWPTSPPSFKKNPPVSKTTPILCYCGAWEAPFWESGSAIVKWENMKVPGAVGTASCYCFLYNNRVEFPGAIRRTPVPPTMPWEVPKPEHDYGQTLSKTWAPSVDPFTVTEVTVPVPGLRDMEPLVDPIDAALDAAMLEDLVEEALNGS